MVTTLTGIALSRLSPKADVQNPSSPAGKALQDMADGISKQPGFQRMGWGMQKEDSNVLVQCVDFDSVDDRLAWAATPIFKDALRRFDEYAHLPHRTVQVYFKHAKIPPTEASTKCTAPITELSILYYPTSIGLEEQAALEQEVEEFAGQVAAVSSGVRSLAYGWSVAEVLPPTPMKDESDKSKAFAMLVGWDSIDAHMQAVRHEVTGKIAAAFEGRDVHEVFHVSLK